MVVRSLGFMYNMPALIQGMSKLTLQLHIFM